MLLGRVIHSVRQGKKQFDMKPEMKKNGINIETTAQGQRISDMFCMAGERITGSAGVCAHYSRGRQQLKD